jgi:hypothetical protein
MDPVLEPLADVGACDGDRRIRRLARSGAFRLERVHG